MRTTLTIDDDVLAVAQERARRERRSVGKVVSELARAGLTRSAESPRSGIRNGFAVLGSRGGIVTNSMIDKIRDDIGE